MTEAKSLSVHIVTWNSFPFLSACFKTLSEQSTKDFTITVVDNASSDGSVRWLSDTFPNVTVLRNFRNLGFSRAHNQAIALAFSRWPEETWPHRYVLVANPDLEFEPRCLETLLEAMERDASIAVCGPKLLRLRATSQIDGVLQSERLDVIDSMGLRVTKARRAFDRGAGEKDTGQYDAPADVFGFSGACVLFRASALAQAKLSDEWFDEDFFAYKEDVDLAWRMQRLGLRAVTVPSAVAWHHRKAPSSPRSGWFAAWSRRASKSSFINFLSTRNHLWVLWKNEDPVNALFHAPWIVPYECAKAIASLFSWSALRGMVAACAGCIRMLRKRFELSRRGSVPGKNLRRWFV